MTNKLLKNFHFTKRFSQPSVKRRRPFVVELKFVTGFFLQVLEPFRKKIGCPITFFRLGLESRTENVIEWNLGRCVGRIETDQTGWADRRRSGNPDEVDLHRPLRHAHLLSRFLHHPHRSLPLLEAGLKSSLSKLLFCRYERPLLLTFLSFPARAKLLSYIS